MAIRLTKSSKVTKSLTYLEYWKFYDTPRGKYISLSRLYIETVDSILQNIKAIKDGNRFIKNNPNSSYLGNACTFIGNAQKSLQLNLQQRKIYYIKLTKLPLPAITCQ